MSGVSGHRAVMLNEVVDALNVQPGGVYVDGTFGRGGHASAVLERLGESGQLIVFDKDLEAIRFAHKLFGDDDRVTIIHGSFANLKAEVGRLNLVGMVDGILLDLGVSSNQLDDAERGFSFMRSGDLDMRMDQSQSLSAAEWVRTVSQDEMVDIFRRYGEERHAKRIARNIDETRQHAEIKTTGQLADIVAAAVPRRGEKKHPATRVFQAIRIHINSELSDIETVLEQVSSVLAPGGRLVVLSFHSLEDRIVKQFMRRAAGKDRESIPDLPIMDEQASADFELIRVAKKASKQEQTDNPRSRSAVLRAAEKTAFTTH